MEASRANGPGGFFFGPGTACPDKPERESGNRLTSHLTGKAARILPMPGLASSKPGFVDRLIHASYTTSGDSMATFDKSAGKLERVRVLK